MIIKLKIKNSQKEWTETYDKPEIKNLENAKVWGKSIVGNFNRTLKPYERKRELVSVEIVNKKDDDNLPTLDELGFG